MTLALPSPHDEAWRWADLPALEAARVLPAAEVAMPAPLLGDAARLVLVDRRLDEARSDLRGLSFGAITIESAHPLAAHAAGAGHVLTVPPGGVARVEIVRIAHGGEAHASLLVDVAADAAVEVVEHHAGTGWSNALTRFTLGARARVSRAVRLAQDAGYVSIRDEAAVAEDARFVSIFLGDGAAGARIDGELTLAGRAAFVDYGGALLTRGDARQECAVAVRHDAPDGSSRQTWRAVAAARSTASLAARVEVARDAQKTDGEQSLRGLLLDRNATVNLKPELEIFADDVKCAHGATVGELDARALFYMQSRGLPHGRARALLTRAFVTDAIARIGDAAVRDAFGAAADRWLADTL